MSDPSLESHELTLAEPNPKDPFWRAIGKLTRNVWGHRQLIHALMMRDIRLKYRGSAFGYFWSLLEPLLMAATFVVLFELMSHRANKDYALSVVIGVIMWGYFGASLQKCQQSLTGNAALIESIYVPREIFGVAAVAAQFVMTALSLLVAVPFMMYLRIMPSWEMLVYLPVGLLLATALALGAGMGSAPWNVLNRDVEYLFTFVTRAGMYLSPVMWNIDSIPAAMRKFVLLNPLVVPMEMVKAALTGRQLGISTGYVVYSIAMCLFALWFGMSVFRTMEGSVVKKL